MPGRTVKIKGLLPAGILAWVYSAVVVAADGLKVEVTVGDGILESSTDGRVLVLFAPQGTDPMGDTDVTSSPDYIYGQNVQGLVSGGSVTLSSGSNDTTRTGVYGWPLVALDAVPAGNYSVQVFMTTYETVTRSDGSTVTVHFPCGDGAPAIAAFGSPKTPVIDIEVLGGSQIVSLTFNDTVPYDNFTGSEIGGCHQGNYEDSANFKHVKIRSEALSAFWNRDMYVGANIVLPASYNDFDDSKRYPVIYEQGHWPGSTGPFQYGSARGAAFTYEWDQGVFNGTNTSVPELIMVNFRHETPFYDDSYAVNTANLGPWGEAINEELIPHIDKTFNTVAKPYARVQEGGSTGGWESIANLIYRPDLFGVTYTSYPDSLDFHRHQDIHLYDYTNAYFRPNGSFVPSIRGFDANGTQVILATTAQENHWELSQGASSRSSRQWDTWNTVFGVQGYNNYPLEPWDKVTGEIYHEAVEYWKPFDLSKYVTSNWNGPKTLGEVLQNRIYVYVGTHDDYFLNEGVQEFETAVNAKGGAGWANFTYLEGQPHGGNYQRRETWDFLELALSWGSDHAPDGPTPLSAKYTQSSSRGNTWEDVLARGGRAAAVARQGSPEIKVGWWSVEAGVGRWDPGVVLEAQWLVNGSPSGKAFTVKQGEKVRWRGSRRHMKGRLQIEVVGRKMGYVDETRASGEVWTGV